MSASVIYGIDFRSKSKDHKVAEGPFDFAAIEAEIAAALWNQDAGEPVPPDYTPPRAKA